MATPRAAEHRDIEQRFRNIEKQLKGLGGLALGRKISPITATTVYAEDNSLNMPTSWTRYYADPVTVPAGFFHYHLMVGVFAGATFASSGNVSVQPCIRWNGDDSQVYYGPAINSGNSSIAVASSFWAAENLDGLLTPGSTFELGVAAEATGTPTAGTGNWHLSAQVIFMH